MSFYPNGQPGNPGRFPVQNHSSGGQSGDYTSRPPPVITRPAHPVGQPPMRAPIRPPHQPGAMNPMMKMMMSMMKSNPNVDSDWIEFCLPRMMEQMQQMSEEFKRKKMVDMISNDDYDRISQALAGMGQIKHPGQTNEQNATNFRRMVGALAMKGKTATPTVPPMAPPVDVQIDPKIQKNRLIIQMRNNLRLKYQASTPTGQIISSLGKVPIELLPGKRHITWVLAVLLFTAEFQMEPPAPTVIHYCTSQEAVLD